MEKLPMAESSFTDLNNIAKAPIYSRLMLTGIELGVFDEMTRFRPAGEIAASLDAHAGNTELFLNALVTIGLVEKKGGAFRNSPESQEFLVQKSPAYMGDYFLLVQQVCVNSLDGLLSLVKNGSPPASKNGDFGSEEKWAQAIRHGGAWVTGGMGRQLSDIVSRLPEFNGFRRMLDLGGGHGLLAIYFVNAHPTMTGVVFDRPAVLTVAEAFIQKYGMQDRVSVSAGDYFKDDIGSGFDFIWASATLNFARHDLDPLLTKVRRGLNDGGVFISFQDGMTHERTRPDTMLGHLGDAMRESRDYAFDQGEICEALLRCGFRSVRSFTLSTAVGEMDLDIARK